MTKRTVTVTTKVLNSNAVVETDSSALSPREKKMFGLTRTRKHKSQENKLDTTHLRWV